MKNSQKTYLPKRYNYFYWHLKTQPLHILILMPSSHILHHKPSPRHCHNIYQYQEQRHNWINALLCIRRSIYFREKWSSMQDLPNPRPLSPLCNVWFNWIYFNTLLITTLGLPCKLTYYIQKGCASINNRVFPFTFLKQLTIEPTLEYSVGNTHYPKLN